MNDKMNKSMPLSEWFKLYCYNSLRDKQGKTPFENLMVIPDRRVEQAGYFQSCWNGTDRRKPRNTNIKYKEKNECQQ